MLPLNSKNTDDSREMKLDSGTSDANGTPQNDANETGPGAYNQPDPDVIKTTPYPNADEVLEITDQNDANKMAEREAQRTTQRLPNTVPT